MPKIAIELTYEKTIGQNPATNRIYIAFKVVLLCKI